MTSSAKLYFYLSLLLLRGLAYAEPAKFSQVAWEEIQPIYKAIKEHPFNQKLVEGTLPKEIFSYYSCQDALYLADFGKVLTALAAKLEDAKDKAEVSKMAKDCLDEEKAAQEKQAGSLTCKMAPATFTYTKFLLATAAYGSRPELAAALLPCFWIYLQLGLELKPKMSPKNPYASWVQTYSANKYRAQVEQMIHLTDRLAMQASPAERTKMMEAFVTATRLEWAFWEGAYKRESWRP